MVALQIRPPTSETDHGSPTNTLFEKSKRIVSEKTSQINAIHLHGPLYIGFLFQTGKLGKDNASLYSDIYLFS